MNRLDEERILQLEAQLNALAQAWLALAGTVEVQGGVDIRAMQQDMRRRRWSRAPDLDTEARQTMAWLCDQIDDARQYRQSRSVEIAALAPAEPQPRGRKASNVIAFPRARRPQCAPASL